MTSRPRINVSIDVPHLDAGVRFYTTVFGFEERSRPFDTMAVLDANNLSVCIHQKAPGSLSSPAGTDRRRYERHWTPVHLDVHVQAFDEVIGKLVAAGGSVEREFRDGAPKPVAFCSDPFGNGVCIIGE